MRRAQQAIHHRRVPHQLVQPGLGLVLRGLPLQFGEDALAAAKQIETDIERLVDEAGDAELFLYPGDQHYFADSSLPSYDAEATALLTERVLALLARV